METATEIVMALGDTDKDGNQTFHSIFDGDPGFLPGETDLTMTVAAWEALGKPDTLHVYAPEFIPLATS